MLSSLLTFVAKRAVRAPPPQQKSRTVARQLELSPSILGRREALEDHSKRRRSTTGKRMPRLAGLAPLSGGVGLIL
jgi:hypothetical protein